MRIENLLLAPPVNGIRIENFPRPSPFKVVRTLYCASAGVVMLARVENLDLAWVKKKRMILKVVRDWVARLVLI
jgi:hypothetical protein